MMALLPIEIWTSIFSEYLGLTYPPPVDVSLVCRDWHSILTSPEYLSLCTIYLQQVDLIRLQLRHRHEQHLTFLDAFPKTSRKTSKDRLLEFIACRFTGCIHLETQLVKVNLESSRSCVALQCISDIFQSISTPDTKIQGLIWHDNSLAHPAHRFGVALQRNALLWGWTGFNSFALPFCSVHPVLHPVLHAEAHHINGERLKASIRPWPLRTGSPSSDAVSNQGLPNKRPKQHSITNQIVSPESSPPPLNRPVIFPPLSASRPHPRCQCALLSLFESLHSCWISLCRFLTHYKHLRCLSLKGVILSEVLRAFPSSLISHNSTLNGQKSEDRRSEDRNSEIEDRQGETELKILDVSFPYLKFFNCSGLRVLEASGSIESISQLNKVLSTAAPRLQTLLLQINPSSEHNTGSPFLLSPRCSATPQFTPSQCISDQFRAVSLIPTLYSNLKTFRLVWASNTSSLVRFLNQLQAPNLMSFQLQRLHVGTSDSHTQSTLQLTHQSPPQSGHQFSESNRQLISQSLSQSIHQSFLSSLVRFIQESGGNSGSLRYLHIDARDLDRHLQRCTSANVKIHKLVLNGLEILASSAVFFNSLFCAKASPLIQLWHCLQIPPLWHQNLDSFTIVKQTFSSINTRHNLKALILPAILLQGEQLHHAIRLNISNNCITNFQALRLSATLKELIISSKCILDVFDNEDQSNTLSNDPWMLDELRGLESIRFHGGLRGDQNSILHVIKCCPNLMELEIPDGPYLTDRVLQALYDLGFSISSSNLSCEDGSSDGIPILQLRRNDWNNVGNVEKDWRMSRHHEVNHEVNDEENHEVNHEVNQAFSINYDNVSGHSKSSESFHGIYPRGLQQEFEGWIERYWKEGWEDLKGYTLV